MREALRKLLTRLEEIGRHHEELYDTECRDRMGNAVLEGFARARSDYVLPEDFGLSVVDANRSVREALAQYIDEANFTAERDGIDSFRSRLAAFQDGSVESPGEGCRYDDFFGYVDPECCVDPPTGS